MALERLVRLERSFQNEQNVVLLLAYEYIGSIMLLHSAHTISIST